MISKQIYGLLLFSSLMFGTVYINVSNLPTSNTFKFVATFKQESDIFELDIPLDFPNISETELEFNFDYARLITKLNPKTNNPFPFFGFPFVARIFTKNNIFRSIADFVFVQKFNNLIPGEVKCGDIIFLQTDYSIDFAENYHPLIKNPYILLTHEHYYSIEALWQLKFLDDNKVIAWFAQNAISKHPKLKNLPIGIATRPGEGYSTLYNIAKDALPFKNKTKLLYLNFTPTTNKDRIKVLEYFQGKFANNSNVKINTERTTWKEYLENIKNSKFILSPPGKGIDCYRTWEALYLGSVPIVLRNGLEPLFADLPVMIVESWTEVTEESMKEFEEKHLNNFSKDGFPWRSKIWLRYWIKEIMTLKFDYIKKFC